MNAALAVHQMKANRFTHTHTHTHTHTQQTQHTPISCHIHVPNNKHACMTLPFSIAPTKIVLLLFSECCVFQQILYDEAILHVCSWKIGRYPDVKKFVHENAAAFPKFRVQVWNMTWSFTFKSIPFNQCMYYVFRCCCLLCGCSILQ